MVTKLMFHASFDSRNSPTLQSDFSVSPACVIRRIIPPAMPSLKEVIERRLSELNRGPVEAATLAGLERNYIRDILDGKKKSVRQLGMSSLAKALDWTGEQFYRALNDLPWIEGMTPFVPELVPVRRAGLVEAGAFRRVDEFQEDGDFHILYEPRDPRFPQARLAYFDVSGDSMNALQPRPILSGDRVVCIDYEDMKGRLPLRDGMVVVVEQTLAGGHIRERSIKQIEIYEDRVAFCPRSTNPKHKPIVVTKNLDADDGKKVEVIAIVRRITNDLPL